MTIYTFLHSFGWDQQRAYWPYQSTTKKWNEEGFFFLNFVAETKELMKENTLATMSSNLMINFLRTGVTNDYLKNLNQLKLKIACWSFLMVLN